MATILPPPSGPARASPRSKAPAHPPASASATSSSSVQQPQQKQPASRQMHMGDGSLPALSHSSSPSSSGSSAPPISDNDLSGPRFVQPAYFYPSDHSVDADAFNGWIGGVGPKPKVWLNPEDDPEATRGIPVFEPTMEEFADFEGYMTKVDHWGRRSGIVKVIPPKEWIEALPPIDPAAIAAIKIKHPIQQKMVGVTGLFRQHNIEKKKQFSVEEWLEKCQDKQFAAPVMKQTDRSDRPIKAIKKSKKVAANASAPPAVEVAPPAVDPDAEMEACNDTKPDVITLSQTSEPSLASQQTPQPSPSKSRAATPELPSEFYTSLIEKKPWLPEGVKKEDYSVEACKEVERKFWRGLGVGEPAWYGADMQGTLFTDKTTDWNVGKLPNLLNRLKLKKKLPGVNTPYLYWGMWRASFCWHVEDMDLYSVNYIHFGAPKCWYAIPQAKADNFERVMKGYFSADEHNCDQFLRHKSFAVSPMKLQNDALRPNVLVQHENEFVFTFPRGYHAGFNMDFNCAESINFAIDSWVELGRRARVCECVEDSVKINVDAVLAEHELLTEIERQKAEKAAQALLPKPPQVAKPKPSPAAKPTPADIKPIPTGTKPSAASKKPTPADNKPSPGPAAKKRKLATDGASDAAPPSPAPSPSVGPKKTQKKPKLQASPRPVPPPPAPAPAPVFVPPPPVVEKAPVPPCVLCPSFDQSDLMAVVSVPVTISLDNKDPNKVWYAHERCAENIPETYFVDVNVPDGRGGTYTTKMIEGVTGISKDRWNLGCSVCTKTSLKKMGGKIQCTKGKCLRAFHVTCALNHPDVELHELEYTETVTIKNAAGVDEKILQQAFKPECLCQTHNPVVKERKRLEALEHRRASLRALGPREIIRIKSKNGQQYDVKCLAVDESKQDVTIEYEDGAINKVPWSHVVLNPPPDHEPAVVIQPSFKANYIWDGKTPVPRPRPSPVAPTSASLPHQQHPSQQQQQFYLPQPSHAYSQRPPQPQYGYASHPQQNAYASSSYPHPSFPPQPSSYHAPPPPAGSYQPPSSHPMSYANPPLQQHSSYLVPPAQHRPSSSSGSQLSPSYLSRPAPGPAPTYNYYNNPNAPVYAHRPLPASSQPAYGNPLPSQHYQQPLPPPPSNQYHPSCQPLPSSQLQQHAPLPSNLQDLVGSYIPPAPFPPQQQGGAGSITPQMREMMQRDPSLREAFERAGWKDGALAGPGGQPMGP